MLKFHFANRLFIIIISDLVKLNCRENFQIYSSIIHNCLRQVAMPLKTSCIYLTAVNITVDADGLITSSGRGYLPGNGTGAGVANDNGGSGGSHGGLGGRGSHQTSTRPTYDRFKMASEYGSGGSSVAGTQVC